MKKKTLKRYVVASLMILLAGAAAASQQHYLLKSQAMLCSNGKTLPPFPITTLTYDSAQHQLTAKLGLKHNALLPTIKLQLVDTDNDAQQAQSTGIIPSGDTLYKGQSGRTILLKNAVVLDGRSISGATSFRDMYTRRPAVSVQTSGPQTVRLYRITGDNIDKPMATVYIETKTNKQWVNGKVKYTSSRVSKVINVATIQSALSNFVITGLDSMKEANNLALQLRGRDYFCDHNWKFIAPDVFVCNVSERDSKGKKTASFRLVVNNADASDSFIIHKFDVAATGSNPSLSFNDNCTGHISYIPESKNKKRMRRL